MGRQWRLPALLATQGLSVLTGQLAQLEMFHVELLKFNSKLNLISKNSVEDSDLLHIGDAVLASFGGSEYVTVGPLIDLGSGNGIPAIVFSILNPTTHITAVDSDIRKCQFLNHIRHALGLSNLEVINGDIQNLTFATGRFTSRGFSSLVGHADLLDKNTSLRRSPIEILCLKGPRVDEETKELIGKKGSTWNIHSVSKYELSINGEERARELVLIKRSATHS